MKNMKYLLRLLGTVTLTGLSVTTLVACGGAPKSNTKFDISKMTTADLVVTRNNVIAVNSSSVSKEEVISAITPAILASVKTFTEIQNVTKADFNITLKSTVQGDAYQPLDLSVNTGSTFVQITSNTKILGIGNKTKVLSYALPLATTIANLKDFTTFISPTDIVVYENLTNEALQSNIKIIKAVVNGINQKFSVNIDKNDFTLKAEKPTAFQVINIPHKITVTANPTSAKITGTFDFSIYLKVDIAPVILTSPLEVPVDTRKKMRY